MANVISCPKCERQLRVPDELLGQSVKCPQCSETFMAELPARQPPPPSSSSRPSPPPRDEEDDRPSRRRPPSRRDDDYDDYDDDRRPRRRHLAPHRGETIQLLGILAFLPVMGFPYILGPIAWVMGNNDLAEMDAGRMDPAGRKSTETGRLCGKIALLIYGSMLVLGLLAWTSCCCLQFTMVGAGGAAGHR